MKVSIITVVYNAVATLEQTIKSVINQSYKNIEYIIVDGGSTDGSLEIIKKYENSIHLWVSESDNGIYDAMNKGIKLATGDIVAFINADDWYEGNIIEKIALEFQNTESDVIYGNIRRIYYNGYETVIKPPSERDLNLYITSCICHQAVFVKRGLFFQYGFFNLNYKIAADYESLLRLFDAGVKFRYMDDTFANYRVGGISSIEYKRCVEEIGKIILSYLDTEEKKTKYYPIVKEKILSAKDVIRIKENEEKLGNKLKKIWDNRRKVYIFGSGCMASECYEFLTKNGILFHGYLDNDINKQGTKLREYNIYNPEILKKEKAQVIVSTIKYKNEISRQLEEMGYKHKEDFIFLHDLLEGESLI